MLVYYLITQDYYLIEGLLSEHNGGLGYYLNMGLLPYHEGVTILTWRYCHNMGYIYLISWGNIDCYPTGDLLNHMR